MHKHYQDYVWVNGKPQGLQPLAQEPHDEQITFRLVADPYYKRISIEKYRGDQFEELIYDSVFLDFRHLKNAAQRAWSKQELEKTPEKTVALLRDQDDRVLYLETYLFEGSYCKECQVCTPQGVVLSTHKMFYTALGDRFNGVVLYDRVMRPVMWKEYQIDPQTGEFAELEREEWQMDREEASLFLA